MRFTAVTGAATAAIAVNTVYYGGKSAILRMKWGCPYCNQICSRKWNASIHIRRRHSVFGIPVPIDDKFNYSRQVFDETPVSNFMTETNIREPLDERIADLDRVHQHLSKVKEYKNKLDRNVKLYEEVFPANNCFIPYSPSSTGSQFTASGVAQAGPFAYSPASPDLRKPLLYSYDSNFDPWREFITGFRGLFCGSCLFGFIIPIYFIGDVGPYVPKHLCDQKSPVGWATVPLSSKVQFVEHQKQDLADRLKEEYLKWSGNQLTLSAYEISSAMDTELESEKKALAILSTVPHNHWLLRALASQSVKVSEEEISEFLKLSENNNVDIFEINFPQRDSLSGIYAINLTRPSSATILTDDGDLY